MNRLNLFTAVALVIVAATLAVRITFKVPATESVAKSSPPSKNVPTKTVSVAPAENFGDERWKALPRSESTIAGSRDDFLVKLPESHPRRAELEASADRVERHANRQLDELTERLELTTAQRSKIFPILARGSDSYHPDMVVTGVGSGAPALAGDLENREVSEVLEPEQRLQQVENELTDAFLWEEIITGLRRQLEEKTGPFEAPPVDENPQAAPSAPRARGNLFDRMDPVE